VLLVTPVMADTAAPVTVSGTATATYSIMATRGAVPPVPNPWLALGDNDLEYGTLTIAASHTAWSVATTTNGIDGAKSYMWAPGPERRLTSPLTQANAANDGFVNVDSYSDSGVLGDTGSENRLFYRQNVVDADPAGVYSLIITYTITAV
jgi:hypothetical protein